MKVSTILTVMAVVTLAAFAVAWGWIAWELVDFKPTPEHPKYDVDDDLVELASLFGSTVAVGTAAVLGIEIKKNAGGNNVTLSTVLAAMVSGLIAFGVFTYIVVGSGVFIVWLANRSVAPDVVKAFAFTFAGWIAGGFAAVFKAAA